MTFKPVFEWDEDTATAFCVFKDKITNKEYTGMAVCHPDDMDMCSKKTGQEIALIRATIEVYKGLRDEYIIEEKALKQLYFSINKSKKFNPDSYETKMLLHQIQIKSEGIEYAKEMIKEHQKNLKAYLDSKNIFYEYTRKRRNQLDKAKQD